MSAFPQKYKSFIRESHQRDDYFGFDVRALARVEPFLRFLHDNWWRIEEEGFERLPHEGPALIVGNASGLIPWVALMLIYSLMANEQHSRRVNVAIDMDWIGDERLYTALLELGFVPWSSANIKRLLTKHEFVAVFPEGASSMGKTISMRNRLNEFDWTKMQAAVEGGVKIFPLATLGCDEASATLFNSQSLSKALKLNAFPVSPFFPWLPFPFNLASLPVRWKMHLLPAVEYSKPGKGERLEECAKRQAFFAEGEIQAELNRLLRIRHRLL